MKKFKLFVIISLLIGVLFALPACGKTKLDAPTDILVDIENQMTWSEVEEARGYLVQAMDENGVVKKEFTPNKPTVSLVPLAEGDYDIRIKAIGDGTMYDDSNWSQTVFFKKNYETGCVYTPINNSTEYAITKFGQAPEVIYIEDTYRGKPVTEIADMAFKGYAKIEEVYVGSNVRTIGESAFQNCKNLRLVDIPDTVTSIGVSAFQSCMSLESVHIPKALTEVKDYTFAYCRQLKDINLCDDIEKTGEIVFTSGITSIGNFAFSDCDNFTSIVICDTVESIGESAFTGAVELVNLQIGAGVKSIGKESFHACKKLVNLQFSNTDNLKTIGYGAFSECILLTSVAIPEGVETVDDNAFCMAGIEDEETGAITFNSVLASVTLPSTIMRVGANAFYGTELYVSTLETSDFLYINNWLVACEPERLATITQVNSSNLQSGVVGIADAVFSQAVKLTKFKAPSSLKYVGRNAFAFSGLTEVELTNVIKIDDYAFRHSTELMFVDFGTKLQSIGSFAFLDCESLSCESLSIPKTTLKHVGTNAFEGTWRASGAGDVIYLGNWVVGYTGQPPVVTLKPGTIGIADYAFYQCTSLMSIVGLSDVEYIGKSAFYGCTNLSSITFGDNLVEIGDHAFYCCVNLYNVEFPWSLKKIGKSAFYKCALLTELDFSDTSLEIIDNHAFYNCINLQTIDFGSSLHSIGDYAFKGCSALTELEMPNSLKSIGMGSFYGCEAITGVQLGSGLQEIDDYAFWGCVGLTSLYLPSSLESVGNYAFMGCNEITFISFKEGLISIGDFAFAGLPKLSSLNLPASLKQVGRYAFKDCTALSSVLLRSTIEEIGDHAFYDCTSLTVYTDATSNLGNWDKYLNSSYRPIVWGCTLSADNSYVVSVTITAQTLQFGEMLQFGAPKQGNVSAFGWATTEGGEVVYSPEQIIGVPVGTTLYAVWG